MVRRSPFDRNYLHDPSECESKRQYRHRLQELVCDRTTVNLANEVEAVFVTRDLVIIATDVSLVEANIKDDIVTIHIYLGIGSS